jgi:hypothetical protein
MAAIIARNPVSWGCFTDTLLPTFPKFLRLETARRTQPFLTTTFVVQPVALNRF